jgi:hypothetical protein
LGLLIVEKTFSREKDKDIVKSSMKSRGMRNEKRARWVPGKKDKRVLSKKGGRAER